MSLRWQIANSYYLISNEFANYASLHFCKEAGLNIMLNSPSIQFLLRQKSLRVTDLFYSERA